MTLYEVDEKIYSLATPYSKAALAVTRLSGEGSLEALSKSFSLKLVNKESNKALYGLLYDKDGKEIDQCVVIIYKKGHGYTKEEAAEIISHGSLPVLNKIFLRLEELGFRKALRGEFTYRAFMHGSLDLTEAEAVEELISSKTEKEEMRALDRLEGSIKSVTKEIKDKIIEILASLEVYLDYGEDEILDDWIFPEEEVNEIINKLLTISSSYSSSTLYKEGVKVVLQGKTNAGKSSFFNFLIKENRAIVSEKEGTTRDFIESHIDLEGIPVRLFDTAGLRDSDDEIEMEGVKRSLELSKDADLVLYVLDKNEEIENKKDNYLYVRSKRDLTGNIGSLSFSSKTGEGVGEIIKEIKKRLEKVETINSNLPVIDSLRQKEKLEEAAANLNEALRSKDQSFDIIALYFQASLRALSELTGEITNDEILETLFSKFCLGK